MTIMHKVFQALEDKKIKYCHFKSNQHLDESFAGKSDFDVIADGHRSDEIANVLYANGGKRFESGSINNYPGIENWLVFDDETGIIYHLHLHYQLLTGTAHVKEYLIWWGSLLLDNAVKNEEHHIMTAAPDWELVLLVTRLVLKCKPLKRLSFKITADMKRELDYLLDRTDADSVRAVAHQVYSEKTAELISSVYETGNISASLFRQLDGAIRGELKIYRRCGVAYAFAESQRQSFIQLYCAFFKKRGGFNLYKKVSRRGGLAIAFIGVDGSGKSTTSKEIYTWLSKKADCKKLYLGAGDGTGGLKVRLLKLMVLFHKGLVRITGGLNKEKEMLDKGMEISALKHPLIYMERIARARVIMAVVKANKKKLIKMRGYITGGGICIMDRFPQLEMPDVNDGPKLGSFAACLTGAGIKKMAERELEALSITESIYPDVIFRLNISLDTCVARKEGHDKLRSVFEKKLKDLESLKYEKSEIIDIDAQQPYEQELLCIKREIWKRL